MDVNEFIHRMEIDDNIEEDDNNHIVNKNRSSKAKLTVLISISVVAATLTLLYFPYDVSQTAVHVAVAVEGVENAKTRSLSVETMQELFKGNTWGSIGSKLENCQAFFSDPQPSSSLKIFRKTSTASEEYLEQGRLVLNDEDVQLPMDCDSIRKRVGAEGDTKAIMHPIAVARNVYSSYLTQELFVSMIYHEKNWFCFTLDSKSTQRFREDMQQLEKCLPNVILSKKEFDFDSEGHFQDYGHYECMKELNNASYDYVLLLQNHDVFLKTAQELSDIAGFLDGAQASGFYGPQTYRYKFDADWTAAGMNLWKNKSGKTDRQLKALLKITKTMNEVFLSADFVKAIVNELDLTTILEMFNMKKYYGGDEMLMVTLIKSIELGLPGQFEAPCRDFDEIVRWSDWNFDSTGPGGCRTKARRHSICIIGIEYLRTLKNAKHLIGNKVVPSFDMGAILCFAELLHNRTIGIEHNNLHSPSYTNLPQVREMKAKKAGSFDATKFRC